MCHLGIQVKRLHIEFMTHKPSLIYIRVNLGMLDIAVHIFQVHVGHSTSPH